MCTLTDSDELDDRCHGPVTLQFSKLCLTLGQSSLFLVASFSSSVNNWNQWFENIMHDKLFLTAYKIYMKLLIWKKKKKTPNKLRDIFWNEARKPQLSVFTTSPSSSKAGSAWGNFRQNISIPPSQNLYVTPCISIILLAHLLNKTIYTSYTKHLYNNPLAWISFIHEEKSTKQCEYLEILYF